VCCLAVLFSNSWSSKLSLSITVMHTHLRRTYERKSALVTQKQIVPQTPATHCNTLQHMHRAATQERIVDANTKRDETLLQVNRLQEEVIDVDRPHSNTLQRTVIRCIKLLHIFIDAMRCKALRRSSHCTTQHCTVTCYHILQNSISCWSKKIAIGKVTKKCSNIHIHMFVYVHMYVYIHIYIHI